MTTSKFVFLLLFINFQSIPIPRDWNQLLGLAFTLEDTQCSFGKTSNLFFFFGFRCWYPIQASSYWIYLHFGSTFARKPLCRRRIFASVSRMKLWYEKRHNTHGYLGAFLRGVICFVGGVKAWFIPNSEFRLHVFWSRWLLFPVFSPFILITFLLFLDHANKANMHKANSYFVWGFLVGFLY